MAPRSKAVSSQANNNGRGGQGSPAQAFKTSRNGTQAGPSSGSQVDFNTLNIQVLRKYRQVFKLNVKARSSKDELVGAVTHHFNGHVVDEVDTIARFLYSIRTKDKPMSLLGNCNSNNSLSSNGFGGISGTYSNGGGHGSSTSSTSGSTNGML